MITKENDSRIVKDRDGEQFDWEEGRPRPVYHPCCETARGRASSRSSSRSSSQDYYLSKDEPIQVHGSKLPHWNQDGKYVFFTFRLADSIPQEKREELKSEIRYFEAIHPKPWDKAIENEYRTKFSNKIEELLDNGYGSCILKNKEVAYLVENTMKYDHGVKYELLDYVIMPNHVHALVKLYQGLTVESLMSEWKSVSSHRLRKLLGEKWCGWMEKFHDRHVRNDEHFHNVKRYIFKNWAQSGKKAIYYRT